MRRKKLSILLTNDDGISSAGLQTLARTLSRHYELSVVAPVGQRSAISHSITLYHPLIVERNRHKDGSSWYAVEGTPADCVKLGLQELLPRKPDLVVSGINAGANTGINIFYSGTVAAAIEAAFTGVPAIAVSLATKKKRTFGDAARITLELLRKLLPAFRSQGVAFNINIPAVPIRRIRGYRIAKQLNIPYIDRFEKRVDPRGREYFWIKGDVLPTRELLARYPTDGLAGDAELIQKGFVTVTPLQPDLTHYEALPVLKEVLSHKALPQRSRKRP